MNVVIPAGPIQLEARIREPSDQEIGGAVVLCHPHPVYGGTMDNRVIFRAGKAANAAGMASLRFNFRGVGASTGKFDRGVGEMEDVSAAIDFLGLRYPSLPLYLIGFSFGAWVGLRVGSGDARIRALVGLGLPVLSYDFEFLLEHRKETLFVVGTEDPFCDRKQLTGLAERLGSAVELCWIEGADHFFTTDLPRVQELISGFLRRQSR